MNTHRFSLNNQFIWDDQGYKITDILPDKVNLVNITTGETQTVDVQILTTALFSGQLRFPIQDNPANFEELAKKREFTALDDCTKKQSLTARYRHWVITPLLQIKNRSREDVILHCQYINDLSETGRIPNCIQVQYGIKKDKFIRTKVSVMNVYRWIGQFNKSGRDIRALIPNFQKNGRTEYLDKSVDEILSSVIEELYLRREKVTIDDVYLETRLRIDEENILREDDPLLHPSRSTVDRRIRATNLKTVHMAKHGKLATKRKFTQYGEMEKAERPLIRIEIDHTPMDIIIIDEYDGLPLGRPTLTSVLDTCTKYPLGRYLGFEPPSYLSVMSALNHSFKPKGDTRELYGTKNQWQAYGLPRELVVDNGKEFKGHSLDDACSSLGINLRFTPIMAPHFKGGVERLFRTINEGVLHTLDGTTFSNVFAKGDYNSLKAAKLDLHTLDKILTIFLIDIYAEKFHHGINGIPARRWEKFIQDGFNPRLPTTIMDLDVLLGKFVERKIFSYGVTIDSLRYNHPDLSAIRSRMKKGELVKIKYDPSNLSLVHVYNRFSNTYLRVPAVNQAYTQEMSKWKHDIIRFYCRKEKNEVNHTNLAWAKRRIRELVGDAKNNAKKTSTRSKIARFETNGRSAENITRPTEEQNDTALDSTSKTSTASNKKTSPKRINDSEINLDPDQLTDDSWDITGSVA